MGREAEIVASARSGRAVVGWKLDPAERASLLERFRPRFPRVVADHVTLRAKVADDTPVPAATAGRIVARADDGRGVETLVVAIDGGTDRPDGGTYHVTWSLGPGRAARESNDVLATEPWQELAEPVDVELEPAIFR